MQTSFTLAQLSDPAIAEADTILRKCVHCGFCTATCPTYVLLGDELDSPRGRIYLIKDMLENDRPASPQVVRHIDRCLSCLSCMTTCPSGVNYMHLVDHAREHIEETYRRPWHDALLRRLLAFLLPYPARFRFALFFASLARPLAPLFGGRLGAMLRLAPRALPTPSPYDRPQVFKAEGKRVMRVALLTGCAQQVLAPSINEATIRLLTRHGVEVVVAKGQGCCGALTHHLGKTEQALLSVKSNIEAWLSVDAKDPLDAIVINASGCGTTVKDYGFMLRGDPTWAEKAARVSALAKDISAVLEKLPLKTKAPALKVAYHAACSLQHGQQIKDPPKKLLKAAGFEVAEIAEGHLCCGSAGTYNLLQSSIAERLKERKLAHIAKTGADLLATGNIGCMTQLASAAGLPLVHTVELLDWASGGPKPKALG